MHPAKIMKKTRDAQTSESSLISDSSLSIIFQNKRLNKKPIKHQNTYHKRKINDGSKKYFSCIFYSAVFKK